MTANPEILGSTEPRIWTPPLRDDLDSPDASYGHDVIRFAREVLNHPLDPWQEWMCVHAGELLEDGRPRFREVLCFVARQNGKSTMLAVLALYWLFVEKVERVHGLSASLDRAREAWRIALRLAEATPSLARRIKTVRLANSQESLETVTGSRYTIGATDRRAGRGLTINRLIVDELREHTTWEAYAGAVPATAAVPDAQIWFVTNQGDDRSVVLKALREAALKTAIVRND
jgi:phage terminase large subunit-like protein